MILFLFFLLALLVFGGVAFILTNRGMERRWQREGPARVAGRLHRRNRAVLLVVLAFLVVVAALEAFIYDFHQMMLDLQYAVGDPFLSEPAGVMETALGGLSWGLYLVVLVGALGGLVLGTWLSCRLHPILGGLRPWNVI